MLHPLSSHETTASFVLRLIIVLLFLYRCAAGVTEHDFEFFFFVLRDSLKKPDGVLEILLWCVFCLIFSFLRNAEPFVLRLPDFCDASHPFSFEPGFLQKRKASHVSALST